MVSTKECLAGGDPLKAGSIVNEWFTELKVKGSFNVGQAVITNATNDFTSERVSDEETINTIRHIYEVSKNPQRYIWIHTQPSVFVPLKG